MKPGNIDIIHKSFEIQAADFESKSMNFTKKEYLEYSVAKTQPQEKDTVLEVAAGTCVCGREFAPLVQTVVCLDATEAMLEIGKKEAAAGGLNNMVFVKGYAEALPFLESSFDIVISRLAFHHFEEITQPFKEMVRVLKPGGKLVLIDMEATEESLRSVEDEIETLRDPSHVKNLSKAEMLELFEKEGFSIEVCDSTKIPVRLNAWMELTKTPDVVREEIISRMQADMDGREKTGFYPYKENGEIYFPQRWILTLGRKGLD